jgi:hypothetical protein
MAPPMIVARQGLWNAALAAFALLPAGFALAACSAAPDAPTAGEQVGSSAEAIQTSDVFARANEWVSAKLKYCQAPNGGRDYDAACSTYCSRQANAQWDPYRSDCSGFVSWAWGLPSPGRVTGQFAPFVTDITKAIQAIELQPGDAVNNSEHIMLFKEWVTKGSVATFLEEPGCSSATPYAHAFTSNVTLSGDSIHVAYNGMTFTAIHYGQLEAAPALKGNLDTASCTDLTGWAQDPDKATAAISVTLTFDAALGKAGAANRVLDSSLDRKDLCGPLGSCNHGFSTTMPLGLQDGKAHTLYAYATDSSGSQLLAQAPKTLTCAVPAVPNGVKRWVTDPTSLGAWKLDATLDVLRLPQAEVDAVAKGADLPAKPSAVIADDGSSPAVWLVDGTTRRHVKDAASADAWHLSPVKTKAATINALTQGPDLPETPFAMMNSGGGAVYVMDVDPTTAAGTGPGDVGGAGGGPGAPSSNGGGGAGSGDPKAGGDDSSPSASSGCSIGARGRAADASWLALFGVAALVRRRRPRA